jgi:general secretion pathway protein F
MGKELPLPTQIMLGVSNLLTDYWWLWLTIIVAIVIAGIKIANNPEGQFWLDRQALKLPLFGTLIKTVDINRFIKTVAILLNNHVPILDAIEVGRKILQNRVIYESFNSITHELKSGSKLSEALSKSTFIPIDTIQLLKVGEESGNLGSILSQAADDHERRMKVKIKKLLALFEPVVILFLAVIILMVVLSIFLAIFEMNEI